MPLLPTPTETDEFFDTMAQAIMEMEQTQSLSWIESKATELEFYQTFLLAVARILACGGSREQMEAEMTKGILGLISARSNAKRQTRHVIYRIAIRSSSLVFIERARQKGLLGWYQHRRLKTRCKKHEKNCKSGKEITVLGA